MRGLLSFILCSLAVLAAAGPSRRAAVIHDFRDSAPPGFASRGPAAANDVINFRMGLTATNTPGLEEHLYKISTPGSELYGQWMSFEDVKAFSAPPADSVKTVTEFLAEHDITPKVTGPFGDFLEFSIPVSKANTVFNAKFEAFTHVDSGKTSINTLAYSLPADVAPLVSVLHPSTAFAKPMHGEPIFKSFEKRANTAPSSCNSVVTPACLQALYGIPTTAATQTSNKLGVSGFINQFAQTADLRTFLTNLRKDIPNTTTFTLQTLDGGRNTQSASQAGIEANLDIQYTVGVATKVPVSFISVGANTQDGDLSGFLDIINFLNAMSAPPQVLTTSYGFDERDLSASLANQLCNAYMSLSARGVSILFASGDGGVSGGQSQSCTTFLPAFPGGCAFQTAVGSVRGTSETGSSFSSGGFSNVFARPSFQASAVSSYLTALGSTNAGKFNTTGRAFPDVAAQGENVEIVDGGQTGTVAGTSCSSPIFASVVSLINDRLIAAGKPVLGFLNPFIYANPGAFFDITTGSNPGCNTNGFPARAGWDPVTGMGTPNFAKLLTAAGL